MKNLITLNLNFDGEDYRYKLNDAYNKYKCKYELMIYANTEEKLETLVNDEKVKDCFTKFIKSGCYNEIENDVRVINQYLANQIDLMDNIEYVEIRLDEDIEKEKFDDESFTIIKKYIDENMDFLKDKKIIVPGINHIDKEDIGYAKKYFSSYDNVRYIMAENAMPITFDELIVTEKKLDEILKQVIEKNLSPLESLMYVYDYVRNRKYKKTASLEDYDKSSDLTSVLLGEYIVCSGFTELLDYFAKQLGFRTYKYRLKGIDTDSHIRLLIHAIDPKYDTDGLYFLDATWECKKDTGNENDFLNSYKFFMKTKKEMSKYDSNFIPDKKLDIDFDIIEQLKQNEMLSFVDLEFIKYNLLLSIGQISKILNKGDIMRYMALLIHGNLPAEEIVSLFEEYLEKINKPLGYEKFCELLYNVRKVQHEEDPDFYPFNKDVIIETTIESKIATKAEKLLLAIFGQKEAMDELDEKVSVVEEKVNTFDFGKIKKIS